MKEEIPLHVRFLGGLEEKNMEAVFDAMLEENVFTMEVGKRKLICLGARDTDISKNDSSENKIWPIVFVSAKEGNDRSLPLKVWITREFIPRWYSVDDRVGWVVQNPQKQLQHAIDDKAKKIGAYKKNAGEDIRLLLFADRRNASGMLALPDDLSSLTLDTKGFRHVYLYMEVDEVAVIPAYAGIL